MVQFVTDAHRQRKPPPNRLGCPAGSLLIWLSIRHDDCRAGAARQLTGIAVLLVWDAAAKGLPAWYPLLRGMLIFAAIFGPMVMAGMVQKAAEAVGATTV
jgi:hypothetical protein